MELLKTTILPTDDKQLAIRMFRQLIFEKPHILMVVLGKGESAETFVQRADRLTFEENDPRWVVWARKPEQIEDLVKDELQDPENLIKEIQDIQGFCLSLTDQIRDAIYKSDPTPSLMRIDKAFTKAEAKQ